MTEIERKALELVNEVSHRHTDADTIYEVHMALDLRMALVLAVERHEAFRQKVSDAVERLFDAILLPDIFQDILSCFIIPAKPDPLVEAMKEVGLIPVADNLRSALDALGFEIREKGQ